MARTLQFVRVDDGSARDRIGRQDMERQRRARAKHAGQGTGGAPSIPRALAELAATRVNALEMRDIRHEPSPAEPGLAAPDHRTPLEPPPLPPPDEELGTRTIMGIGARAVRATAKAGEVEARPARREPRGTPAAFSSQAMRASLDEAPVPSVEVASISVVQPMHLPPEELAVGAVAADATLDMSTAEETTAFSPISPEDIAAPAAPIARPAAVSVSVAPSMPLVARAQMRDAAWSDERPAASRTARIASRAKQKQRQKRAATGYRVLAIAAVTAVTAVLAAYIATIAFYAFSKSWAAPLAVSQTDEKVAAVKSSIAVQQQQRARLAAELRDAERTFAAQQEKAPTPLAARDAAAQRDSLRAAIAHQDELIRGLEQSPYLRALADGAHIALVPYDNLGGVGPGTQVVTCRFAMVMCHEVGRVREVLPGELTFRHPRREKMMRGQMVELQLSEPAAASEEMLFLGGAPVLF
jgi:hypothetical protein